MRAPGWAAPGTTGRGPAWIRAVRPRQWTKNGLAAGAPLAAGRITDLLVLERTAIAIIALCLASSAVYLINDVHDRDEDREHPRKRNRPVASGQISPRAAAAGAVATAALSLALSWVASPMLAALVAAYLGVSLGYTLLLRREPVIEMVTVATGFVLRASAGGAAAQIPLSPWFLLVAGFGALFLVSGKRYSEVVTLDPDRAVRASLAAYSLGYLRFVWVSAATLTVVTYLLWANQVSVVRDEGSWALWSMVPFLLALLRYALDIDRGRAEAPEDLALGDRQLQAFALIWLIMVAVGAGGVDFGM